MGKGCLRLPLQKVQDQSCKLLRLGLHHVIACGVLYCGQPAAGYKLHQLLPLAAYVLLLRCGHFYCKAGRTLGLAIFLSP